MCIEFVYVMLKPDTLEFKIRDIILKELVNVGGQLIASKTLILNLDQISIIYSEFPNERAKKAVFHYFTTRKTEHLIFMGEKGIHEKYQIAKGKTGTGIGIKGRHYTRYTKLTPIELEQWFEGTLTDIYDIDLEMFGRDILHIPNSPDESRSSIQAIFSDSDLCRYQF